LFVAGQAGVMLNQLQFGQNYYLNVHVNFQTGLAEDSRNALQSASAINNVELITNCTHP
jgi:hypothetical protein